MTDDNSYSANMAQYRRTFPILDHYLSVIEEHCGPARPLTEPSRGMDVHVATRVALERLGRPADEESVYHAYAYVARLQDEVEAVSDKTPPTLTSVLVDHFWQSMSHLPTPEQWAEEQDDDQQADAEAIAEAMTPELLAHAVRVAMPALLQQVIDENAEAHRG
ncbi:MAG TPA: hypothetical protein VD864_08180 [Nocardioides sp.]|nr:hypothetical protein [Nocardioides sp.]